MTRDDIIRMAKEAKLDKRPYGRWAGHQENLERFAALVAAAERERIIAANAPHIERANAHINALEEAVLEEREECAKVCDELERPNLYGVKECAAAIRGRK